MEVSNSKSKGRTSWPLVNRDVSVVQEICRDLKEYVSHIQRETSLRGQKDLEELKLMTKSLKDQDELSLTSMEGIMSIVNLSIRKQILRDRLINRITDEKEIASILQTHREEFSQFIWKRRLQSKKEMSNLFQSCSNMVSRFGELISETTLDAIQLFNSRNEALLCKSGIQWGFIEQQDCQVYFGAQIYLIQPLGTKLISVSEARLDFELINPKENAQPGQVWGSVIASDGVWAMRLFAKPLVRDIVIETYSQLRLNMDSGDRYSFVLVLARMIDLVHPSQKIQTAVMAYPGNAVTAIKRRLLALGYSLGSTTEDSALLDAPLAIDYLKQINRRLEKEHHFYFEFSAQYKIAWRVGLTTQSRAYNAKEMSKYPGQDSLSMGLGSDGLAFFNGKCVKYLDSLNDGSGSGFRAWGILVDLYFGNVSLVFDGRIQMPVFGSGATHFSPAAQKQQRMLILKNVLYPMFSLAVPAESGDTSKPTIRTNFGERAFVYNVNALDFNQGIKYQPFKDCPKILDAEEQMRDTKDGDDKIHMSAERNFLRNAIFSEPLKSFSQFPPSVYRRTFSATRIQRTWRRYRGFKMRAAIRKEQNEAAIKIQRLARKKLKKIRSVKNQAAFQIQKAWRHKLFIRKALIRCIYRKPLRELHRASTIIQRRWRDWHMYRNSPLAAKYRTPIDGMFLSLGHHYLESLGFTKALHLTTVLKAKVRLIIDWWRPLHAQRKERLEMQKQHKAATDIQRVFRGYYLRQLLRPDLRKKLRAVGESVVNHRAKLFEIRGAYVLQNAWRSVLAKRVRSDKMKTRNLAAARIQALWKGFWNRSLPDISVRFSYGQAVFLNAVCKGLRNAHFILKMYKPCQIVCPRDHHGHESPAQMIPDPIVSFTSESEPISDEENDDNMAHATNEETKQHLSERLSQSRSNNEEHRFVPSERLSQSKSNNEERHFVPSERLSQTKSMTEEVHLLPEKRRTLKGAVSHTTTHRPSQTRPSRASLDPHAPSRHSVSKE